MAVPQTTKKVGAGGCVISIVLFVLSIAAVVIGFAWGIASLVGILTDLKTVPSVAVGESGQINVNQTGTQFLFFSNVQNPNTILPLTNPTISIKDPSGNSVVVDRTTSTSSSSSSGEFRILGSFDATTTGTYDLTVGDSSNSQARVYLASFDVNSFGLKIVVGFAIGFVLFIAALIVGIMWLVRRSRAKKSNAPPPYQGGYGGPPGAYGSPGGYPGGPAPYPGGPPPAASPGGPPVPGPPAAPAPGPPPAGQWGTPPPGPPPSDSPPSSSF